MDNSQSSDVFSETSISCNSSIEIMDNSNYDSLLNKTKASLCNSAQVGKVSLPSHFSSLLDDCRLCISQSLDLVVNILLNENLQLSKLSQYMEDAVCLLQLLSSRIKSMVESISMSCCTFKTFPTTTGHIIMLVFTHCKNSESVYGVHLINVQKQLKDLFRTCHELQLTYLMVLEKHFIFDLTESEQLDILIEALNMNLQIGEVVQSLDVKTMAEQWKAYMAICEKYSSHLMDKHTFRDCTQLLCTMIMNNLKNATEADQEEKVIIRSLKVTNFTVKILLKMCSIFKHASVRDNTQIVDLLIYVYLHDPAYLETVEGKSSCFLAAMSANVSGPSDVLLKELIMDDQFVNFVLTYNTNGLQDVKLLGYVFLIIAIAKFTLQKSDMAPNYPKHKLIHCMFKCLPQCHTWLNIGIRFRTESEKSIGLFEYMLIYATGLAGTMSCEEMAQLEKIMYEAVLGTECVVALFSSNLWTALARLCINRPMLLSQVFFLCQMYQKLETHKVFIHSPQRLHISYTLAALFDAMRQEDKVRIFKQFNPIENQKNMSLWSVLKIKNLPKDLQRNIQEEIMERYINISKSNLQSEDSFDELVQVMKLLSSCSLTTDILAHPLVQSWMRACSEHYDVLSNTLDSGTLWYYEYIVALVSLTIAVVHVFCDNGVKLIKVLHVISNILNLHNTELNLLLIDLLCKLATIPVFENKHVFENMIRDSFTTLFQDNNNIIQNKLHSIVSCNKRLERVISSAVSEETWNCFKSRSSSTKKLKEILEETSGFTYVHKCIERRDLEHNSKAVDQVHKTASSNFDFADLDTLFDSVSDSEPASKKMKLDVDEAVNILERLEKDSLLLCNVKENMFTSEHRRRIRNVCEKLNSLVT